MVCLTDDQMSKDWAIGFMLGSGHVTFAMAKGFIGSAEYAADYGTPLIHTRYVEQLYKHFFNRASDDS